MLNPTKKRAMQCLMRKAFFSVLIVLLLAPMMLVVGQQTTGGLRRFFSKESKVGFRYPAGWKLEPGDGSIAGDNFSRLASVSMPEKSYPRTNFIEAKASVAAGSVSEAACKEFEPNRQSDKPQPRKIRIGNLRFDKVSVAEGAAGSVYRTETYRTFHDGKCYEVSLELQTALMAAYDPGTVKAVNYKTIFNLLGTVVRTLYFAK